MPTTLQPAKYAVYWYYDASSVCATAAHWHNHVQQTFLLATYHGLLVAYQLAETSAHPTGVVMVQCVV
jgi:hypothetical protein